MITRDRAIGVPICERPPTGELRPVAEQAALALELTSGYTDAVHAVRRRKEIHPTATSPAPSETTELSATTPQGLAGHAGSHTTQGGQFQAAKRGQFRAAFTSARTAGAYVANGRRAGLFRA